MYVCDKLTIEKVHDQGNFLITLTLLLLRKWSYSPKIGSFNSTKIVTSTPGGDTSSENNDSFYFFFSSSVQGKAGPIQKV